MSRRLLLVCATLLFVGGVVWYAFGSTPTMSFAEAAQGGSEKKGIVVGTVTEASAPPNEAGVGFRMRDASGGESPVTYTGANPVDTTALRDAQRAKRTVSVMGHSHGSWFHATELIFK